VGRIEFEFDCLTSCVSSSLYKTGCKAFPDGSASIQIAPAEIWLLFSSWEVPCGG